MTALPHLASPTASPRRITRRAFLQIATIGALGFGLNGALAAFLEFVWPRGVTGFGGPVTVAAAALPVEGDAPTRVFLGKFWLVRLAPGEGVHRGFGEESAGGLLALWQTCPHLGCVVPWNDAFTYQGVRGWFRCGCHGSTYTRAGVRVAGPAPRSMDTMPITLNDDGSITVATGAIRNGALNNPTRAVVPA